MIVNVDSMKYLFDFELFGFVQSGINSSQTAQTVKRKMFISTGQSHTNSRLKNVSGVPQAIHQSEVWNTKSVKGIRKHFVRFRTPE